MNGWVQVVVTCGTVATALVAIAEVIRRGINHLKGFVASQVAVPLAQIRAEFSPDSGQSLKDATDRIELQIQGLRTELGAHVADMALHTPKRRATDRRSTP